MASPSKWTDEQKYADCLRKCEELNKTQGVDLEGYDCPKCKNKGFVFKAVKGIGGYWYETRTDCECVKARRALRRLERSGLKNIIKDYTFKSFQTTEPWQQAVRDAGLKFIKDDNHKWFFIGGASGAGKTHICTAIAGYYLRSGKEVRYMLWRDEAVKLKASVTDSDQYASQMQEIKTAEVLYIDDLFKTGKDKDGNPQRPTVADINLAFEIINYRYNNPELVTIISSECRAQDILDIDEAVGGRIVERTSPYGYGINIKPDRSKNYRLKGSIEL